MFKFISRNFPHLRSSQTEKLYFLQVIPLSTSSTETLKSTRSDENKQRFKVNYLINTFGFTPVKALSAAKYMSFETPERPDSVNSFLKNHGFTKTQIFNMARSYPPLLLCDPEKTLLPKIQFFQSLGFSSSDINATLSTNAQVFKRSLEKKLMPTLGLIRGLFQCREKKLGSTRRSCAILCHGFLGYVIQNIETLREWGFPDANIAVIVMYRSRALRMDPAKFRKTLDEVKEMGFNPLRLQFLIAVHVLRSMNKSSWQRKVETYKNWGWSEDEIFGAFRKNPWFMIASRDKIMGIMNFLVNNMGFESSVVLKRPGLICYSLQKTIIPRCTVYQALYSKGLVPKNFSLKRMLEIPEKKFLEKFVECFEVEAPELLMLYKKNMPIEKM